MSKWGRLTKQFNDIPTKPDTKDKVRSGLVVAIGVGDVLLGIPATVFAGPVGVGLMAAGAAAIAVGAKGLADNTKSSQAVKDYVAENGLAQWQEDMTNQAINNKFLSEVVKNVVTDLKRNHNVEFASPLLRHKTKYINEDRFRILLSSIIVEKFGSGELDFSVLRDDVERTKFTDKIVESILPSIHKDKIPNNDLLEQNILGGVVSYQPSASRGTTSVSTTTAEKSEKELPEKTNEKGDRNKGFAARIEAERSASASEELSVS